jgi:hypothetical protein
MKIRAELLGHKQVVHWTDKQINIWTDIIYFIRPPTASLRHEDY